MKVKLMLIATWLVIGSVRAQDSLNCRQVGTWPFGPNYAVAVDSQREEEKRE